MELNLDQQAQLKEIKRRMLKIQLFLRSLESYPEFKEELTRKKLETLINFLMGGIRICELNHFEDNHKVIITIAYLSKLIKSIIEFNNYHQSIFTFKRISSLRELILLVKNLNEIWIVFFGLIEDQLVIMIKNNFKKYVIFHQYGIGGIKQI